MKKLKLSRTSVVMLMAMSSLYGCGSGDDPVATDIPKTLEFTSADIGGSVVKGTMSNAKIELAQLNGSTISEGATGLSTADGSIDMSIKGKAGFALDSMVKMTVSADGSTSMMCDAVACGSSKLGETLSGAPLTGTVLHSLAYVEVPYANGADGKADATFQANALTTIATALIEQAVADGRNVSVRQLYELTMSEFSDLTFKALGLASPGINVFDSKLISAERYENFVADKKCEMVPSLDSDGNPINDENGDPVLEEKCTDILHDAGLVKASLLNAAFANITEFETFNGLFEEAVSRTKAAMAGDTPALDPIRQRLLASVAAVPFLDKLSLTAEDVIDVGLAFASDSGSAGPVREVTTAQNLTGAIITARNRISDGEAEAKAFDGDTQTKWLDHNDHKGAPTVADPSWIQIQFTQAHAVNSVFITSANDAPARDPENFNVQASNDGANWVKLAEFVGETFDERLERKEFRFSNGIEYSYYRLNITKNKGDDTLMQLSEIQFAGPIHVSVDHTDPASDLTITARNRISDGEAETKAFDNGPNTKWLDHNDFGGAPTEAAPSWVQVVLPQAQAVNALALTSANDSPSRDPENFNLQGSNDAGKTWITLGSWLGESFDERFERKIFSVDNILAYDTYRLNITKNKGDDTLMQVAEIELIGPKQAGLNYGRSAGVEITARNRIGDGEAEIKAFDGDSQTKWLDHNDHNGAPTVADPSWVQVKLPEAAAVNKLALISANDAPARDPENFNLQGSNDGTTWITLASWLGESFDERFERKQLSFGNDLGFSYYRLNITKNKGDDTLMQVAEIELLGPQYVSVDHSSVGSVTFTARNRISDGEAESKAFDDDAQTKWLDHNDFGGAPTVADPSWVQIDLPSAKIVSSIAITSANDAPSRDPENFNLQGSNDGGKTWVTVGSWIGETFDNRFERKLFEMGNGFAYSTYRLNITKNKGDDTLMQLAEIELIGPEL